MSNHAEPPGHGGFEALGDGLELDSLAPGDLLRVNTLRSTYFFRVDHPAERAALMWKQGGGKPPMPVCLMGCVLGSSSSMDPRRLFCGGSLEYTHTGGTRTHVTSSIVELAVLRRVPGKD